MSDPSRRSPPTCGVNLSPARVPQVSLLPENDRWSETRAQLLAQMDVSMGGRVAEELIFGDDQITTGGPEPLPPAADEGSQDHPCSFRVPGSCVSGASSDFDGATKIAKMMVTRFGMSDKVNVCFCRCPVAAGGRRRVDLRQTLGLQ